MVLGKTVKGFGDFGGSFRFSVASVKTVKGFRVLGLLGFRV